MNSKDLKNIYLPLLVLFISIFAFVYINYLEPSDSVEKIIMLKASHDPKVVIPEGSKVPKVHINLVSDKKTGVNIKVDFENFVLTPEHVNTEDRPGEGHMHLYVNGFKIARVYSDWFHIDDEYLKAGENTITVTLNTNMHNVWTLPDGSPVEDTVKYFKVVQ